MGCAPDATVLPDTIHVPVFTSVVDGVKVKLSAALVLCAGDPTGGSMGVVTNAPCSSWGHP